MVNEESTPAPWEEVPGVVYGEIVQSKVEAAYEMRLAGLSHSNIAEKLGYGSRMEVARAIQERMKSDATRLTIEDRESILTMELDRLDRLRSRHWEAAMMGDLRSGEMLLKISDRVMKLTGIDAIDTATQSKAVLVIGGLEKDYVQALKELSE